jgi:hypothetical protein
LTVNSTITYALIETHPSLLVVYVLQAVTPKGTADGRYVATRPPSTASLTPRTTPGVITGEEDNRRNAFLTLSCATYWRERCELLPISPETVSTIRALVGAGGDGVALDTSSSPRPEQIAAHVRHSSPCPPLIETGLHDSLCRPKTGLSNSESVSVGA